MTTRAQWETCLSATRNRRAAICAALRLGISTSALASFMGLKLESMYHLIEYARCDERVRREAQLAQELISRWRYSELILFQSAERLRENSGLR